MLQEIEAIYDSGWITHKCQSSRYGGSIRGLFLRSYLRPEWNTSTIDGMGGDGTAKYRKEKVILLD